MIRFGPDTGPVVVAALPLFEEANRTRAFMVTQAAGSSPPSPSCSYSISRSSDSVGALGDSGSDVDHAAALGGDLERALEAHGRAGSRLQWQNSAPR